MVEKNCLFPRLDDLRGMQSFPGALPQAKESIASRGSSYTMTGRLAVTSTAASWTTNVD